MTATELRHQTNLQRWAQAVQECRSSGVSVKAWCETQGITTTMYYRWERAVLSEVDGDEYDAILGEDKKYIHIKDLHFRATPCELFRSGWG